MSDSKYLLSTELARATFSAETGALIEFASAATGWNVVCHPELGQSFRLLIPLEERRNNSAWGSDQSRPTAIAGEDAIEFTWDGVTSQHGGAHAIRITQRYELTGASLSVTTEVRNDGEHIVENVFSPYLGGLRPQETDGTLTAIRHDYGSGMAQPMWPTFENSVGYYGVDVPTQLAQRWMPGYGTPVDPYTLIQGDGQGLYMGVTESSTELVAWHAELWPGYGDSLESSVALQEEVGGVPVRIQFAAVHLPYVQPGETRRLTPIVMTFYAGDWHDGADLYAQWRSSWLTPPRGPEWVREPHTWQQIQINSPEDELRIPFDRLIEVGREAAAAGVTAIQLVGFNVGGQDRDNPSHEPEPRLGGRNALRTAIRDIQALGVKVVLFAKFNWADRSTRDFREKWITQAVKDPYGDYYLHPGYKYETVTQILDINTRRLIPMCFLSEAYLEECMKQFDILLDLGADGILYDECLHHLPTLLCFDTSHGHRYGAPTYANDRELIRRFRKRVGDRPDFVFAGEAIYDWEFEQYDLSYHRSENRHHFPLHRYTAPQEQMMTAVTGFDDRNMVNQAFLYRYILSYEPHNFKGRLPDFPDTVAYGTQMEAARAATRKWTWDGTFRDTVGAAVTQESAGGTNPYTVFEAADGTTAVCIANYDQRPNDFTVRIDGFDGPLVARTVDGDSWQPLVGGRLSLAARSAAVVAPESAV